MNNKAQKKYAESDKGKLAQSKAQKKYDTDNLEKRREQKKRVHEEKTARESELL